MRTKFIALAVLLMLVLTLPIRAEDVPSITTWGKATVYVVPDRAVISVGVHSSDVEFQKAITDNRVNAEKLLTALKGIGIAEKDIASSYVSTTLGTGLLGTYTGYSKSEDNKYHIFRSYTITVSDLKFIDKVLDTAMANGANQTDGVDLQTSQLATYRDQARQQAIRAAKDKAVLLAKELNQTVGRAKTISETNAYSYTASGGIAGNSISISGPEEREPSPVFIVGKIPVDAAVLVTFILN